MSVLCGFDGWTPSKWGPEHEQDHTPFLWFNDNAEDAAGFYLSVFPEAKKLGELPANDVPQRWPRAVALAAFSYCVACKDQAEIDRYWDKLLEVASPWPAAGWRPPRRSNGERRRSQSLKGSPTTEPPAAIVKYRSSNVRSVYRRMPTMREYSKHRVHAHISDRGPLISENSKVVRQALA